MDGLAVTIAVPNGGRDMSRLDELSRRVSENLRRIRRQQSLSQETLAAKAGVHRTYIGAVERGERSFSLQTLGLIARALGIDPRELLAPTTSD